MGHDEAAVAAAYLEHLTERDLAFICGANGGAARGDLRAAVHQRRGGVESLLNDRALFEALFVAGRSSPLVEVSPFLVFAVAVRWVHQQLASVPYVHERVGPGHRAPVFDVPRLRDFLAGPWRSFFLAELLASYARVASGSLLVRTPRGLRRRRFSELDPVAMAGLLDLSPEAERPGLLRRLGDLALFLTGVFPDYVGRHGFGPVDQGRLHRAARRGGDGSATGGPGEPARHRLEGDGAVALLSELGKRWYQAASRLLPSPAPANVAVVSELPSRFDEARRVLSIVAERLLFPYRDHWFAIGPG